MRYPKRTALAITCACFAVFASAASAAVKPTIISLSVTPRALPASGGAFTAYVRVRHDVTCTLTFYHANITKHTFKCSDGHLAWHLHAPPASEVEVMGVCLEAHNGRMTSERCVSVSRLGNTHPAAPVSTPTTTTAPPPRPSSTSTFVRRVRNAITARRTNTTKPGATSPRRTLAIARSRRPPTSSRFCSIRTRIPKSSATSSPRLAALRRRVSLKTYSGSIGNETGSRGLISLTFTTTRRRRKTSGPAFATTQR
jgi:hypothetical protein